MNIMRPPRKHGADTALTALVNSQDNTFTAPKKASDTAPDLDIMHIYLRTCLREKRNIDTRPRVTGMSMSDTAFGCIRSLMAALKYASDFPDLTCKLIVMDDHSDPQFLDEITNITSGPTGQAIKNLQVEVISLSETGQGASLYSQFDHARQHAPGLCYFVEDDYLHDPDAIIKMWQFYKYIWHELQSHCVIYPQEHHFLYHEYYPSYLLAYDDRHWRTMRHATHTLLSHGDIVRQYWGYFENTKYVGIRKKRKKGSENRTTNRLFQKIPGFSPLKPVAAHLQFDETLPPLYNWQEKWDAIK